SRAPQPLAGGLYLRVIPEEPFFSSICALHFLGLGHVAPSGFAKPVAVSLKPPASKVSSPCMQESPRRISGAIRTTSASAWVSWDISSAVLTQRLGSKRCDPPWGEGGFRFRPGRLSPTLHERSDKAKLVIFCLWSVAW